MDTVTWKLGTNKKYDHLFGQLQEKQYNNTSIPLWKNYNLNHFESECSAVTIAFDDEVPIFCSSILGRDCWPIGAYRVINRLWKINPDNHPLRAIHAAVGPMIKSQLNWLKNNTDYKLVFISRESSMWQNWTIKQLDIQFNLNFKYDDHKYLTCDDQTCNSCWQRIIFCGDSSLLESWKRQ